MRMSSVQRRFQRYKIIYIWKIIMGLNHNFGISWTQNDRRGRLVDIPIRVTSAPAHIQKLRRQSLAVTGGLLFNCMPVEIRNWSGSTVEGFKKKLDGILSSIPDCPPTQDLTPVPICQVTGRNSNSPIAWTRYMGINTRCPIPTDDLVVNDFASDDCDVHSFI